VALDEIFAEHAAAFTGTQTSQAAGGQQRG
jgi:hypothetical protein